MIRKIVENQFDGTKKYVELACLHADTKPLGGMVTGSLALEVDTGDIYAYDETDTGSWAKIAQLKNDEAADNSRSVPVMSVRPAVLPDTMLERTEEPEQGEELKPTEEPEESDER